MLRCIYHVSLGIDLEWLDRRYEFFLREEEYLHLLRLHLAGGHFLPNPVHQMITMGFNKESGMTDSSQFGEKGAQRRLRTRMQMHFRLLDQHQIAIFA